MPNLTKSLPVIAVAAAILAYAAAACSPPAATEHTRAVEAGANHVTLPVVDAAAIFDGLSMDETLEVVSFAPVGAATVSGEVSGYRTKLWAVPVAAGQTLRIDFQPADADLYINVLESTDMGGAVHRGEIQGPSARLTPTQDTVYLIEPFQPRANARDEGTDYRLTVSRS
jgi:hypothetical protein